MRSAGWAPVQRLTPAAAVRLRLRHGLPALGLDLLTLARSDTVGSGLNGCPPAPLTHTAPDEESEAEQSALLGEKPQVSGVTPCAPGRNRTCDTPASGVSPEQGCDLRKRRAQDVWPGKTPLRSSGGFARLPAGTRRCGRGPARARGRAAPAARTRAVVREGLQRKLVRMFQVLRPGGGACAAAADPAGPTWPLPSTRRPVSQRAGRTSGGVRVLRRRGRPQARGHSERAGPDSRHGVRPAHPS